jgi:hypothetical protein
MTSQPETKLAAIDGRDALAFVIIRPGGADGNVSIEAAANGMSKAGAAYVLRHVADQFDADTPSGQARHDVRTTVTTLAERWEQMATNEEAAIPRLNGPAAEEVGAGVAERCRTYRKAAADLLEALRTGRIPHDLMTDAELGG